MGRDGNRKPSYGQLRSPEGDEVGTGVSVWFHMMRMRKLRCRYVGKVDIICQTDTLNAEERVVVEATRRYRATVLTPVRLRCVIGRAIQS